MAIPGMSSGAKYFARNSAMAQKVAGGLHAAASRVGTTPIASGTMQRNMRNYGSRALTAMGNYPRRTMAGGGAALGAMGYSSQRRRGSQNYPMY